MDSQCFMQRNQLYLFSRLVMLSSTTQHVSPAAKAGVRLERTQVLKFIDSSGYCDYGCAGEPCSFNVRRRISYHINGSMSSQPLPCQRQAVRDYVRAALQGKAKRSEAEHVLQAGLLQLQPADELQIAGSRSQQLPLFEQFGE